VLKMGKQALKRPLKSGFTLIELIIVIGIISSVTVISTLSIGNFLSQTHLKSSAEDIASTLRWARRLAITKRANYKVVFDTERGRYWIEDEDNNVVDKRQKLRKNILFANPSLGKEGEGDGIVELDDPDDDSFSFYPQGTAEAGSIYIQNKNSKEWWTITISGTTGYVRIYQEKH